MYLGSHFVPENIFIVRLPAQERFCPLPAMYTVAAGLLALVTPFSISFPLLVATIVHILSQCSRDRFVLCANTFELQRMKRAIHASSLRGYHLGHLRAATAIDGAVHDSVSGAHILILFYSRILYTKFHPFFLAPQKATKRAL
jgi:hypothetical protein